MVQTGVCRVGDPASRRRKLFVRCEEVGLNRDERIELACYLLRRDITSFKQLDDHQVCRMLDALEGYELIDQLLAMRV
jgi:hypothetical protein